MTQLQKNTPAIILITSLFFLWGFALNLNPILIPHLKKACLLSDAQSALIDSASYIAYFLLAIPAGRFMQRFGYKGGILFGLCLFALGAYLFFPAAATREYGFFLTALFIIACGLTFLETAANPYITILGDPETATQRINFAQSFNGLAATLAPLIGGTFILSGKSHTDAEMQRMPAAELDTYLQSEADTVIVPFMIIGTAVLLIAILLYFTRLPDIKEPEEEGAQRGSIWKEKNLWNSVIAQFFYVGAQVCVSSFFIRFAERVAGIEEKAAALLLGGALFGFMAGRFIGTFLMKYIRPGKLLALYSIANILLILVAVFTKGKIPVYALVGVEFFMSIMFPTIFSLGIQGLGRHTKEGSSFIIMSIVGGALFPFVMGAISDASNIQFAYIVPGLCFLVVLWFARQHFGVRVLKKVAGH